jgi:hypothetical protein
MDWPFESRRFSQNRIMHISNRVVLAFSEFLLRRSRWEWFEWLLLPLQILVFCSGTLEVHSSHWALDFAVHPPDIQLSTGMASHRSTARSLKPWNEENSNIVTPVTNCNCNVMFTFDIARILELTANFTHSENNIIALLCVADCSERGGSENAVAREQSASHQVRSWGQSLVH